MPFRSRMGRRLKNEGDTDCSGKLLDFFGVCMESIRCFVGHSFNKEDQSVVSAFLDYLDVVSDIHAGFSWEHAARPEPNFVDEKVIALFKDKNLFVGICTRKELVISPANVSARWWAPNRLVGEKRDFLWKTSDWVIQEIGFALGRGLKIILLIEEGTKLPGALQGNLEYIEFSRNAPQACFDKLLGMIAVLVRGGRISSQAVSGARVFEGEAKEVDRADKDPEWTVPQPDWKVADFELAFMHFVFLDDHDGRQRLSDEFLKSTHGASPEVRNEWAAFQEYVLICFGKGGRLAVLDSFAVDFPQSARIREFVAKANLKYGEYGKAASYFVEGAKLESAHSRKVELLGEAALALYSAGRGADSLGVEEQVCALADGQEKTELSILKYIRKLAQKRGEKDVALASMERLMELNPSDADTRFDLAYLYSENEQYEMAAFHYSRIPIAERTDSVWNNLGVAQDNLDMPVLAVDSYRRAYELGNTLAASNLANKQLDAGLKDDAKHLLDEAAQKPGHDVNVDRGLARIGDVVEREAKLDQEILQKAREICDFRRAVGRSLTCKLLGDISGRWKGPNCELDVRVHNAQFLAKGSYSRPVAGLASVVRGLSFGAQETYTYAEEFQGNVRGGAILGDVVRRRLDSDVKSSNSLLIDGNPTSPVLMWVDPSESTIHVLEWVEKKSVKHYTLVKL
jgi:Flp pilus assembly protein TadD